MREKGVTENLLDSYLFGGLTPRPIIEPSLPNLPYSPDQLFWISFGQNWCSKLTEKGLKEEAEGSSHPFDEYRVNGIVANSPFFYRDFGCPVGSRMNPEEKCKVWGFQESQIERLIN